jgi:hypothetical protein
MSFKKNKYLFNIFNIMLNEILEFGIIIYCCYDTYKNVNFDINTEKIIKYFEELKDEREYIYKLKDDGLDKQIIFIESNAIKIILKMIDLKKSIEKAPFIYKINEKCGEICELLIDNNENKEIKKKRELNIKTLSKKNNVIHIDKFKEIVNEHFNTKIPNKLIEHKTGESDDNLEEYVIGDILIDEPKNEKIIDIESTTEPQHDIKKDKIKINNEIPDEVDMCEIDFGENINKLLSNGKKEMEQSVNIEKKTEKIKIKVGKKKKINSKIYI